MPRGWLDGHAGLSKNKWLARQARRGGVLKRSAMPPCSEARDSQGDEQMDEISEEAQARGLTPEILESLLNAN